MAQPVPFASPTRPDGQAFADIDRNLRAIRAIESSWSLPALPDMVKLDIAAMSGLDPSGISDFAYGLDADITDTLHAPQRLKIVDLGPANTELMSGTGTPPTTTAPPAEEPAEEPPFGGFPDLRQFLRATAGQKAPQDVEGSASILAFKERAIRRGYLDADDVTMDERWNPELNSVIWQMSIDDFARRKSGDSPALGSSIGELADFFYDWLSPTGLANAAVDLGFWWDPEQIQKEWDRWSLGGVGDSLKKFLGIGRDESFGDLRDLWKMLGPVDDLVMPLVNMALLATGVGEVYHFSRAVMIAGRTGAPAYRGLRAWQVAEGASKWELAADAGLDAGRLARAFGGSADRAADLARMSRPGLLGGRLPSHGGDIMAGWRNLRGVMIAKKGVQQTMRIGFVSRLEHRLGYTGTGLEEILPGAPERFEELTDNWYVWGLAEVMFTPYNILEPGTLGKPFGFVKDFSRVGQHAHYSDEAVMAYSKWIQMGDEVAESGMDAAQKQARRGEQMKLWQQEVREKGATKALASRLTGGNEETLGGYMLWVATMAAIEAEAATLSLAGKGLRPEYIRNAIKYNHSYVQRRSGLIGQIRYIDPDDPHGFLWYKALSRSNTEEGAVKRFDRYVEAYERSDDNVARRFVDSAIAKHNEQRQQVWGQIMGAHMQPGMLAESMALHLKRFGAWDEFVESTDDVLAAWGRGDLESAAWAKVVSPETGVPVGAKRGRLKPQKSWFDTPEDRTWLADFQDIMEDPDWLDFNNTTHHWNGMFDAAARSFPKHGRFTMAKPGTILYGDKATEISVISFLEAVQASAREFKKGGNRQVFQRVLKESSAVGGFERITEAQLGQVLAGINDENVLRHGGTLLNADQMRRIKRVQRYVRKQQLTLDPDPPRLTAMGEEMAEAVHTPWLSEVDGHIAKRLEEINRSDRWVADYGIDSTLSLAEKTKALRRQLPFTAAEVDMESIPAALAAKLQGNGYKLVHGTEFAAPADLLGLEVSIADLVDKTKYIDRVGVVPGRMIAGGVEGFKKVVRGVGRGVQRFEPEYVTAVYRSQLRTVLHKQLMQYKPNVGAAVRNYDQRSSVDLEKIVDILQRVARELGDEGIETWRKSRNSFMLNRAWANVQSAFTPAAPADLVKANQVWKAAVPRLRAYSALDGLELSDRELVLIHAALKESRVVGRTIRGSLINTKDKLQSKPQLTNALRLLGRTQVATRTDLSLFQKGAAKFGAFSARGYSTYIGGAMGTGGYLTWSDKEWMEGGITEKVEHLAIAMSAALAGRMAGGAIVGRAFRSTGVTKAGAHQGLLKLWHGDDPKHMARTLRAIRQLSKGPQLASRWDASVRWRHWAYMADASQTIRDFFRFTLSPVFDASRYTEGMVLAQVGGVPEDILAAGGLRFNMSPSKWRSTRARELAGGKGNKVTRVHKEDAAKEWDKIVDEFSAIGRRRADFDFDALEAGTARFRQIGVLGFNTTEWMASMYGDLTRIHNMDPLKAYEAARSAFTYGTKPRSAIEMNVNAVFFPFSFMKKTAGHMAEFLSKDWSRAVMMHDAVRTYELLNDEFDLDQLWRNHAPILEKFHRLNLFAYGITPGEFGGADRPLIDFWNSTPMAAGTTDQAANYALMGGKMTPILNLFIPQGLSIRSEEEMINADKLMRRVAPLMNDVTAMLEDLQAQGHVFFGGNGRTKEAEATLGFDLVRQFRYGLDMEMRFAGFQNGIEDIGKKAAQDYQDRLTEFRDATLEQLPGYMEAYYDDVIYNSIVRDGESGRMQRDYAAWSEANPGAFGGMPPADESELRVGYLLAESARLTRQYGGYDAIPLDRVKIFLDLAGSWAEKDDTVRIQWREYLRRRWGTIETVRD